VTETTWLVRPNIFLTGIFSSHSMIFYFPSLISLASTHIPLWGCNVVLDVCLFDWEERGEKMCVCVYVPCTQSCQLQSGVLGLLTLTVALTS
jgi:hypothetical protein